ncbi:Head-tail adaptor protein, partial [Dysosmobacter welbionis]
PPPFSFSISHTPVDVGGAFPAAHGAGALRAALDQGHTAGADTGPLLHGQLTLQTAAPLGPEEAALPLHNGLGLLGSLDVEGVVLPVLQGHGIQIVMDVIQQGLHGALQ